jgi:hypothetical protein
MDHQANLLKLQMDGIERNKALSDNTVSCHECKHCHHWSYPFLRGIDREVYSCRHEVRKGTYGKYCEVYNPKGECNLFEQRADKLECIPVVTHKPKDYNEEKKEIKKEPIKKQVKKHKKKDIFYSILFLVVILCIVGFIMIK